MGTKALIGALNEDGSVVGILLLHDGYPDYAGRKLLTHWHTWPRVKQLLELGDLNYLGDDAGEAHNMDAHPLPQVVLEKVASGHWCQALIRDRIPYAKNDWWKERFTRSHRPAQIYEDLCEFLDEYWYCGWPEYAYLYEAGRWYVYLDCEEPRKPVEEYMAEYDAAKSRAEVAVA